MKPRDSALKLKRFEVNEKARKVASLETMISDFDTMAVELSRQIAAEEDRTGIKDPAHFAYSMFAKAAANRRANLVASVDDLRVKLDNAKRELEEVSAELSKLEPQLDVREAPRPMHRRLDRVNAMIG
jgi:chromosome segregation ATPase